MNSIIASVLLHVLSFLLLFSLQYMEPPVRSEQDIRMQVQHISSAQYNKVMSRHEKVIKSTQDVNKQTTQQTVKNITTRHQSEPTNNQQKAVKTPPKDKLVTSATNSQQPKAVAYVPNSMLNDNIKNRKHNNVVINNKPKQDSPAGHDQRLVARTTPNLDLKPVSDLANQPQQLDNSSNAERASTDSRQHMNTEIIDRDLQQQIAQQLQELNNTANANVPIEDERTFSSLMEIFPTDNTGYSPHIHSKVISQVMRCWKRNSAYKARHQEMVITITVEFDQNGAIAKISPPDRDMSSGRDGRIYIESFNAAVASLWQCTPLNNMPADSFNQWQVIKFNFHH